MACSDNPKGENEAPEGQISFDSKPVDDITHYL
jgi:hypothetical protein